MNKDVKITGLSSFGLSLIAAASMTVDHAAVVLAAASPFYYAMRSFGRIAFVIFAFLLAQSADKTSSIKRFCLRLAAFAVMTEPIFDITFYQRWFYMGHQNVFFTLLLGVICCKVIKRKDTAAIALATGIILAAQYTNVDYGGAGVLLITAFNFFGKEHLLAVVAAFIAVFIADGGDSFCIFALAAVPMINIYNGIRGGDFVQKIRKWIFYIYYPAHIAFLSWISTV